MSYCISQIIGIRTGGVFSGKTNLKDMKKRISKILKSFEGTDFQTDIDPNDPSHCMSRELESHKGSYVVLAGVFNYWDYEKASKFASRLSKEFGVEIMHMAWDEEIDKVQCQVWLTGKPLLEVNENPIGRILRRVA